MEDSKLPLQKWACTIYLEMTSLKGASSMKLRRDIGVTQRTAWIMLNRRGGMKDLAARRVAAKVIEGEGRDEGIEDRDEEVLGDARHGAKVLELRDFVDDVDEVDALVAAAVAEMHGVDAQEAGLAVGLGRAADADGDGRGPGLAEGGHTHTGLRAAPVSFLRVQRVLNGRRRATMADGDGDRRRTLGPGTPGTPERHDRRLGRRTRLYPPPRAPGAN